MVKSSKKLHILLGIIALLSGLNVNLFSQGGESAVPFLLISPTSRSSGMGEAGAGIADDASAVFWNPGGLGFQEGQEISLTHTNWLPAFNQSDLFYDYLNYRITLPELGTFATSITYLSLGKFQRTTSAGPDVVGEFSSYEYAITAGYAAKLLDELGFGVNLRLIHSALSPIGTEGEEGTGIATTVSGDIGILYKIKTFVLPFVDVDLSNVLSIGLNLSNLGPKITYIDAAQADPLPTNIRLGFGAKVLDNEYNNLVLALDFSRLLVRRYKETDKKPDPFYEALFTAWGDGGIRKIVTTGGFEYWYGKPKLIAIRAGYLYEDPEYGNRKYFTFGAGLRYDIYGFDFSYIYTTSDSSPLANTLRFSILLSF
jgi:hypothetical protein